MLFHVRMDVQLPPAMPAAQADELKKTERELAQSLQRSGKWRHLWRIAGQYANVSMFDVDSIDELHALLTAVPVHANRSNAHVPPSVLDPRHRRLTYKNT